MLARSVTNWLCRTQIILLGRSFKHNWKLEAKPKSSYLLPDKWRVLLHPVFEFMLLPSKHLWEEVLWDRYYPCLKLLLKGLGSMCHPLGMCSEGLSLLTWAYSLYTDMFFKPNGGGFRILNYISKYIIYIHVYIHIYICICTCIHIKYTYSLFLRKCLFKI